MLKRETVEGLLLLISVMALLASYYLILSI
jgi:hypothetical protein